MGKYFQRKINRESNRNISNHVNLINTERESFLDMKFQFPQNTRDGKVHQLERNVSSLELYKTGNKNGRYPFDNGNNQDTVMKISTQWIAFVRVGIAMSLSL